MEIYKTTVQFIEDGQIVDVDTIEYKDMMWLVAIWNEIPEAGLTMPARIICLDVLPHQRIESGDPADFVVNAPLPKSVFDGEIPKQIEGLELVVIENPDIRIETAKGVH